MQLIASYINHVHVEMIWYIFHLPLRYYCNMLTVVDLIVILSFTNSIQYKQFLKLEYVIIYDIFWDKYVIM